MSKPQRPVTIYKIRFQDNYLVLDGFCKKPDPRLEKWLELRPIMNSIKDTDLPLPLEKGGSLVMSGELYRDLCDKYLPGGRKQGESAIDFVFEKGARK